MRLDPEDGVLGSTLTPKQQRFVQEYLIDLNATQAAIRTGYSAKTAEVQGCRLLSNAKIAQAVSDAMKARAEDTGIDQKMVIAGLIQEAKAAGEDTTSSARIRAWELLGKHLGMFTDKTELSGNLGVTHYKWMDPE